MNIYDCFMYFDEDLLLDIRLNILNDYVSKFVITEATYAHNGAKKKLKFDVNNFKKFKEKIEYIVVDTQPSNILSTDKEDDEKKKARSLFLMVMQETIIKEMNWQKVLKMHRMTIS